jgi:hypothetical protein
MKVESTGAVLSTVFVDYDNIYLSLKRKNEEAAKRFAKDAALWLREIESGRLITPTNGVNFTAPRRIVMTRCYGNPVPRRNANDNSTDMNSFPFVRHHFLRAGFEVVDCPPLTAQLKNSADIRMVMDVRDVLNHETRFEEFILLSGDADFTPVLHRLRAHARRTVVFANDHTAQPYTAISDGEIREADLISLLLEGRIGEEAKAGGELRAPTAAELEGVRKSIVAEVVDTVRGAQQPVPLEALADRAVRALGHDKTVGWGWGGAGGFRELLARALPKDIKLTEQPPYFAYEPSRQIARDIETRPEPPLARDRGGDLPDARYEPRLEAPQARRPEESRADAPSRPVRPDIRFDAPTGEPRTQFDREPRAPEGRVEPRYDDTRYVAPREARNDFGAPQQREPLQAPIERRAEAPAPRTDRAPAPSRADAPPAYGSSPFFAPPPDRGPLGTQPVPRSPAAEGVMPALGASAGGYAARSVVPPTSDEVVAAQRQAEPARPAAKSADQASQIQQSIARIHEACQAPPLSPPEYRVLFEVMAEEITANNLSGQQTLTNIVQRAREMGLEIRRDDVRFVLEVVSEADPWFEQGASANLFASRFRNFVVARCRSQNLNLSADEIDLIDAWFGGAPPSQRNAPPQQAVAPQAPQQRSAPPAQGYGGPLPPQHVDRWQDTRSLPGAPSSFGNEPDDEFPRIVRSRLRG